MRLTEAISWVNAEESDIPLTHYTPTDEDKKLRPKYLRAKKKQDRLVTLFT